MSRERESVMEKKDTKEKEKRNETLAKVERKKESLRKRNSWQMAPPGIFSTERK